MCSAAPSPSRSRSSSASRTHAINAALYAKLPYDSMKDFSFVAMVASTPLMLVVHPSTPAHTVRELIALLKSGPGKYSYGSSGTARSCTFPRKC